MDKAGDGIKTELLAPAGDEESLRFAIDYGADAVYLAGKSYGMRAAAKNFDDEALLKAVSLAHSRGVKVYLACNILPTNGETDEFPRFIETARGAGVDAAIAADIGVIAMIREYAPKMAIHASTQTGIVNWRTAAELYRLGVKRAVLARELDLQSIREIRERIPEDMELEAFVHGAMCVSFSGRCLISEYLTGRNANHGECAQPCRWNYCLMEETRPGQFYKVEEDERGSYILNARDLCMIEHLDDVLAAGITSLKIEGRAKSAYYTALTVNAYRAALDAALNGEKAPRWAADEVDKISHRPYCTGFFYGYDKGAEQAPDTLTKAGQFFPDGGYIRKYDFAGTVDSCENGFIGVTVRNHFTVRDELEIIAPKLKPLPFSPEYFINESGERIDTARHAMEKLKIPVNADIPIGALIRKKTAM